MFNIHCIHIAHQLRSMYTIGIIKLGKYNKLRNIDVLHREIHVSVHSNGNQAVLSLRKVKLD